MKKSEKLPAGALAIQNDAIRVIALSFEKKYYLKFQYRDAGGPWRTVVASGLEGNRSMWQATTPHTFINDPLIEWSNNYASYTETGLFSEALLDKGGKEIVLRGGTQRGGWALKTHTLEQRVALDGPNRVTVTVTDEIAHSSESLLGKLMTQLFFTPDGRAQNGVEPHDFAWIPTLHRHPDDVVPDHVFRAPAAVVQFDGLYAALVPDLDLLAKSRPKIRHALDLRVAGVAGRGEEENSDQAPRLYYGFCDWTSNGHSYYRHPAERQERVTPGTLSYGFQLFLGCSDGPEQVVGEVNDYLWNRYGRRHLKDIRPQVMPFEEYGRKYAYPNQLARTVRTAKIGGKKCVGIHNAQRRGSNFHAWENDMHMSFGIRHYGDKWSDKKLKDIAAGIRQLILSAPRKEGAFPCVYNFDAAKYEGTLYWVARAADPYKGYDTGAMGVTTWWMLYWLEHFGGDAELLESVKDYAKFLAKAQRPSGAVPTYFFADFTPAKPLMEAGTTAISGAVLAKAAALSGDEALAESALAARRFIDECVVPSLLFYDFETFYSCSSKPIHWIVPVTGIRPQNNLCLQWACDQFLALYDLTGDEDWLARGEYLMGLLSFYHQVWTPPHYNAYLFGGFGVMNTDGEWNDGRQARFVSTYADYYEATGDLVYLERAVAACRATFALMDIEENHANAINSTIQREPDGSRIGRAPENVFHAGPSDSISGWSGFNWEAGGGLAASAYLERLFGSVWVDGRAKRAIAIDGVTAAVKAWKKDRIELAVESPLKKLPHPYTKKGRKIVIRFGHMPEGTYTVTINKKKFSGLTADKLSEGLTVKVD